MSLTISYCGQEYSCVKALKGTDYLHLIDSDGHLCVAFEGVTDFSVFGVTGGSMTDDEDDVAVIKERLSAAEGSLSGKQDTISDLATIRTGAAKGATALQSVPSTYRTASAQDTIDNGIKNRVSAVEDKLNGSGTVTFSSLTTKGEVEIYSDQPHIDLHFGNSTSDYTTRIIETTSGKLNVMAPNGVLINDKQIGGWETVSLTVVSSRLTNTSITAKYNPILGMVFVRIYGKANNITLNTGDDYDLLNIPSGYRPGSITALAIKCSANAHACAKSSGVISIRPFAQITTHDIYISGFWFV